MRGTRACDSSRARPRTLPRDRRRAGPTAGAGPSAETTTRRTMPAVEPPLVGAAVPVVDERARQICCQGYGSQESFCRGRLLPLNHTFGILLPLSQTPFLQRCISDADNGARGDASFFPLTGRRGDAPCRRDRQRTVRPARGRPVSAGARDAARAGSGAGRRPGHIRPPHHARRGRRPAPECARLALHGGRARVPRPAARASALAALDSRRSMRPAPERPMTATAAPRAARHPRARASRSPPRRASRARALVSGHRASSRHPAGVGRPSARPGARSSRERVGPVVSGFSRTS